MTQKKQMTRIMKATVNTKVSWASCRENVLKERSNANKLDQRFKGSVSRAIVILIRMRLFTFIVASLLGYCLILSGCGGEHKLIDSQNKYILTGSDTGSKGTYLEIQKDTHMIKFNFRLMRDTSLVIRRYFLEQNGEYYEKVYAMMGSGGEFETVYLPMLSTRRDTTYHYVQNAYPPPVQSIDFLVKIFKGDKGLYFTEKYWPYDTTLLIERFTYDEDFTIHGFDMYSKYGDSLKYFNPNKAEQELAKNKGD